MRRFFFDEDGWLTGRGAAVIFGALLLVMMFVLPPDCTAGGACP